SVCGEASVNNILNRLVGLRDAAIQIKVGSIRSPAKRPIGRAGLEDWQTHSARGEIARIWEIFNNEVIIRHDSLVQDPQFAVADAAPMGADSNLPANLTIRHPAEWPARHGERYG
ncbi:MAG: hypothetical protein QOH91_878, partial [Mycobacterium sp.]|nr:hypothetical protein [Mycobacterium sp.]